MSNPLYKAKALKGNWVFGYYYEDNGRAYILDNGKAYEVDKETRCQKVGKVKDHDIYEHDFVRGRDLTRWIAGEVVWIDDLFVFSVRDNEGYCNELNNLVKVKVLGNKFDKRL